MWKSLIITILLWTSALVARSLVASFLRSRGLQPTELRRTMATSRNVILFILSVATATVWFDELRTFAVSLVAVAFQKVELGAVPRVFFGVSVRL